jgi:hypothetical protein
MYSWRPGVALLLGFVVLLLGALTNLPPDVFFPLAGILAALAYALIAWECGGARIHLSDVI